LSATDGCRQEILGAGFPATQCARISGNYTSRQEPFEFLEIETDDNFTFWQNSQPG
jgi:hypothetical protein